MKYNLNATKISTLAKFELTNLPWWLWLTLGVVVAGIIVSIVLIATLHKEKTKKKLKVKVVEQQNEIVENVNKEDSFEEIEKDFITSNEFVDNVENSTREQEEEEDEREELEIEINTEVSDQDEPIEENDETTNITKFETEEDIDEDTVVEKENEAEKEEINESVIKFVDGFGIVVRYNKSFKARLIQSQDELKNYYNILKNELLSYKKVKSRISWNYESLNAGRNKIAKFNVRGKTLKLYLALDPDDYAETKYKVERSDSKRYEEVPCMYRITNPRRLKYAIDLISTVAENNGLTKGTAQNEDFYLPYESTEALVEQELIKELVSETAYNEYMRRKNQATVDKIHREFVSAAEVNAIISDEIAVSLVENTRKIEDAKFDAGNRIISSTHSGKKGIINIDVLSASFEANDKVTLKSLKEKGLINKNIGYVKVLARGILNKPLEVELNDYSIEAVKMIILTGGKVKRV